MQQFHVPVDELGIIDITLVLHQLWDLWVNVLVKRIRKVSCMVAGTITGCYLISASVVGWGSFWSNDQERVMQSLKCFR